jgi:hypothetical protein
MTTQRGIRGSRHVDAGELGERRGAPRPRSETHEAAIERIVQRVGELSEFTDVQIRQIAAIALIATAVDDADRQRRDETARENRRRVRALGRQ